MTIIGENEEEDSEEEKTLELEAKRANRLGRQNQKLEDLE